MPADEIVLVVYGRTAAAYCAATLGTTHGRTTPADRPFFIDDGSIGVEPAGSVSSAQNNSAHSQGNDSGNGYSSNDFLNTQGQGWL